MINSQRLLLALFLGTASSALAQSHTAGSFEDGGDTQVSAMMMFLGNEEKVYILDKSENNAAKFGNFPAMGSVYDIAARTSETMTYRLEKEKDAWTLVSVFDPPNPFPP